MMLTQKEFADYLGVSFETVNRWENGRNIPTMKIRRKLSLLFLLFNKYKISLDGEKNE